MNAFQDRMSEVFWLEVYKRAYFKALMCLFIAFFHAWSKRRFNQ